jgi:4-hydroxy-3-methylbut-2-enyl diphosphate reductase
VIDATCPLVSKVHAEAGGSARAGYTIMLVGHAGHDEIEGTLGEAPDSIRLVEDLDEAREVEAEIPTGSPTSPRQRSRSTRPARSSTSCASASRLAGPRTDDICYATQNRQDAVRALASECDAILVVGSSELPNSMRLVEVAERPAAGAPVDGSATWIRLAHRGEHGRGDCRRLRAERVVQDLVCSLTALGPSRGDGERRDQRECPFPPPAE